MVGLGIGGRQRDLLFRTQHAWSRFAAAKNWRPKGRRAAIVEFLAGSRHKRWETEEEANAHRHRTLLEDDPTSG
jgi:hypothetical protein